MKKTLKLVTIIFLLSYLINLFWEVAHSFLYNWNKIPLSNNVYFYIPKILFSTFGDAFIILIIFLVIFLFIKGFNWIKSPKKQII